MINSLSSLSAAFVPEKKNTPPMDEPMAKMEMNHAPTEPSTPPSAPLTPPKKKVSWKLIAGLGVLLLLVIGGGASYFLVQTPQELRQQAAYSNPNDAPENSYCGANGQNTCRNGGCDTGYVQIGDQCFSNVNDNLTNCGGDGQSKCSNALNGGCDSGYEILGDVCRRTVAIQPPNIRGECPDGYVALGGVCRIQRTENPSGVSPDQNNSCGRITACTGTSVNGGCDTGYVSVGNGTCTAGNAANPIPTTTPNISELPLCTTVGIGTMCRIIGVGGAFGGGSGDKVRCADGTLELTTDGCNKGSLTSLSAECTDKQGCNCLLISGISVPYGGSCGDVNSYFAGQETRSTQIEECIGNGKSIDTCIVETRPANVKPVFDPVSVEHGTAVAVYTCLDLKSAAECQAEYDPQAFSLAAELCATPSNCTQKNENGNAIVTDSDLISQVQDINRQNQVEDCIKQQVTSGRAPNIDACITSTRPTGVSAVRDELSVEHGTGVAVLSCYRRFSKAECDGRYSVTERTWGVQVCMMNAGFNANIDECINQAGLSDEFGTNAVRTYTECRNSGRSLESCLSIAAGSQQGKTGIWHSGWDKCDADLCCRGDGCCTVERPGFFAVEFTEPTVGGDAGTVVNGQVVQGSKVCLSQTTCGKQQIDIFQGDASKFNPDLPFSSGSDYARSGLFVGYFGTDVCTGAPITTATVTSSPPPGGSTPPGCEGPGCTPPPPPGYFCNSPCTADAQCQTADSRFVCSTDQGNRCRLASNPTSDRCQPPTGPMCLSISYENTTNPGAPTTQDPQIGDAIRLTCGEVSGAARYIFRVIEPDGTIVPLTATGRISSTYAVSKTGNYAAQCQICTGPDDSSCLPYEGP